MISHKNQIIFIHIPKCAGSSIERLVNIAPFDWTKPDYKNLTGWCPKRKIHLQHATAQQLLELELINKKDWDKYLKFTIVRNPWARALSDYLWMNRNLPLKASFKNYINAEGFLKTRLTNPKTMKYRGDHLLPQSDFIYMNNELMVDKVIKMENLEKEFEELKPLISNLNREKLPHEKKGRKLYRHYSHFYSDDEVELVRNKFEKDIINFNYEFIDKRDSMTLQEKINVKLFRRQNLI